MAKILVVDDELFYRELVSDVLQKAKHDVVLASSGKEALNIVAKFRDIDIVLTDVVMPDMNGLVVLSRIQKKDASIPVIMLSAHEDHRIVLQSLKRGAFDYQKKPISQQELVHSVDRALKFRALQAEKEKKLSRLSNIENGARRLSEMVVGEVKLDAIAREFELLQGMANMVAEVLECDRVSFMLLNPENDRLEVAVSVGLSKKMVKQRRFWSPTSARTIGSR